MLRIRVWIRMYFGFSRTETNAFLILIPVLILILFSEPVYRWWSFGKPTDFSGDRKALDSLIARLQWMEKDSITKSSHRSITKAFHRFDPNSVSENDLTELGLSKFLAHRVLRFREKGGRFHTREDLLKIYGMDSSWYDRAAPWIAIVTEEPKFKAPAAPIINSPEKLDINQADSMQLIKVYGIGPALSRRILTFRNRLGGFASMNQLRDVYGLDSATVEEIRKKFFVSENYMPVLRINLNAATLEDLMSNPYIRRREAQAIVSFRMQHGNYDSISRLKEIRVLTPEWIEKVKPYLTLD